MRNNIIKTFCFSSLFLFFAFLFIPASFIPFKIGKTFLDPRFWALLSLILGMAWLRGFGDFKKSFFELLTKLDKKLENKKWLIGLAGVSLLHLLIFKIYSYMALQPSGADFSHYDYAFWNFSNGRDLINTMGETTFYYNNILGNHFTPILYLISFCYFIYEWHFWPLFFQAILAFSSLGLLFFFALAKFKERGFKYPRLYSLIIVLSLWFNKFFISILKYEFHVENFYLPSTIIFIWGLDKFILKKRYANIMMAIGFILLMSIKEDFAFITIGLGISLFFILNSKRKILALLLVLLSSFLFIFLYTKVMPIFQKEGLGADSHSFLILWGHYGSSLKEVALNLITHPHWIIRDILTNKAFYQLYSPFIFLSFLTPWGFSAIPILALNSTASGMIKVGALYYSSNILILVVVSTIYGLLKLKEKMLAPVLMVILLLNLSMGLGAYRLPSPDSSFFSLRESIQKGTKIFKDEKGIIYLTGHLFPQTPYDLRFKRIWNSPTFKNAKGIIFGKKIDNYPLSRESSLKIMANLKANQNFKIALEDENLLVFKRIN